MATLSIYSWKKNFVIGLLWRAATNVALHSHSLSLIRRGSLVVVVVVIACSLLYGDSLLLNDYQFGVMH